MQLGQVIVFVVDLDRMRRFYADGFGLAVTEQAPGWIRFATGGAALALHAIPPEIARGIAITDPPAARTDTAIKFTFHVDDVDAARTTLAAHGAAMREVVRWGGRAFCDGVDPEGNVFQIATA